jgi:hypothetical protein
MKYEALAWGFHSPALQDNHEVLLQVTHVYDFAFEFDVRVFFHEQPTYVREEEASFRVVRIGVSF